MMPQNRKESNSFLHRGRPEYIHPSSGRKLYQQVVAEMLRIETEISDILWQIDSNFLQDEESGRFMSYIQAIILAETMLEACNETDKLVKELKTKTKLPELQQALKKPVIEYRKDAEGFLAVIELYKDFRPLGELTPVEETPVDDLTDDDAWQFFVNRNTDHFSSFDDIHSAITRAVDLLSIPDMKILTKYEKINGRRCQVIYGELAHVSKEALMSDVKGIQHQLIHSTELPAESRAFLQGFEPEFSAETKECVAELTLYIDLLASAEEFSRN